MASGLSTGMQKGSDEVSFSGRVKAELLEKKDSARHCLLAELAAFYACAGGSQLPESAAVYEMEKEGLAERAAALIWQAFHIKAKIQGPDDHVGIRVRIENAEDRKRFLMGIRIWMSNGVLRAAGTGIDRMLLQKECCRRSVLRAAFLCAGSVSNPKRSYHFEITIPREELAGQLVRLIKGFSIEAKMIRRKDLWVVYVKEGSGIADLLGLMGARVTMLEFENERVVREVRGVVNRRVNCETANIEKTATAAARQIEDIRLIAEQIGFGKLTNALDEIAEVRLQYPEATLKELGEKLDPPVGKSGVNHRLRKLHELAESLR